MEIIKKIVDYEKVVAFWNDFFSAISFVAGTVVAIFTGFNTLTGAGEKNMQRVETQQKGKRLCTILYLSLSFSPSCAISMQPFY